MAKSVTMKQRSPEIGIVWNENVPQATYFKSDGYCIVAKVENGQYILARYGWDEDPQKGECVIVSPKDTLIKSLGKRFALKEPHNSFVKILASLERRGIPYVRK